VNGSLCRDKIEESKSNPTTIKSTKTKRKKRICKMSTHSQVPTAIKIKQKMAAMLLQKHLAREIQTRVFHLITQSLHLEISFLLIWKRTVIMALNAHFVVVYFLKRGVQSSGTQCPQCRKWSLCDCAGNSDVNFISVICLDD
jgi:hypothetical protein